MIGDMVHAALRKLGIYLAMIFSVLVFWQLIVWWFQPESWLFPSPTAVWQRFQALWSAQALQPHLRVTVIEVFAGYGLGIAVGLLSGYPISQIRSLEKIITPYLVAANSVPLVAFAPLLLLWFGNGIGTKIIVAGLIVYFPVTINTIAGFQQQSSLHTRLMRSLHASKWQRFIYLELPSAIPGILAGMKIGAPLAVIGAVVGEFLGSGLGLGHLIMEANGLLDTPQLFVAIIFLAWMGIFFYLAVLGLEYVLIGPWHHKKRRSL